MPLPQTGEEIAVEHERQEEQEAEESRTLGYAEWEVRVDLPTHKDAVELAERLEAAGITPLVRRWKYLLIGTATDDDARALAERIRAEAPPGCGRDSRAECGDWLGAHRPEPVCGVRRAGARPPLGPANTEAVPSPYESLRHASEVPRDRGRLLDRGRGRRARLPCRRQGAPQAQDPEVRGPRWK